MAAATATARVPARVSAEDRRQQILAVAMSLFARQGFEGTTTRQIADMARVNEAIIFRHFPTKEDLYWAIIEGKCKSVGRSRMMQERLQAGGDDVEMFTAIAEAFLRRTRQDNDITRLLLFTALERHELSDAFFSKYVAETYDTLALYVRRRVAEGSFRAVDPMLAARAFIGMIVYHFLVQEVFGWRKHQPFEPQHAARTLAELWLHGVTAGPVARNGSGSGTARHKPVKNGARQKKKMVLGIS